MLSDMDCRPDSLTPPLLGRVCRGRDRGGKRVTDGEDMEGKMRRLGFEVGDVTGTLARSCC